jgi:hypothetical protein
MFVEPSSSPGPPLSGGVDPALVPVGETDCGTDGDAEVLDDGATEVPDEVVGRVVGPAFLRTTTTRPHIPQLG